MNKQVIKNYAVSSLITFLTGFLAVIAMHVDTLSLETLRGGALLGIVGAGVRAGVKACIEYLIANTPTQQ